MATKERYDLAVIGSGPGGYPAAVRAAQLGLKTVCIEKSAQLGGVCLNSGCIPSKALLDSSELYHLAKHRMIEHGIQTGDVRLDLPVMMARKAQIVEGLTRDVRQLLERNRVDIVHGQAYLEASDRISVTRKGDDDGTQEKETVFAKNILLATGSVPIAVPNLAFDGERIVSSTEALNFESVPGRLGIVGGGYVGLELGSVWQRLGADVTVIEMLDQAAGLLDGQVSRTLSRLLKRQGLDIHLKTRVIDASVKDGQVDVSLETKKKSVTMGFDRLLVCAGRRPLLDGMGLGALGIETDPATGRIIVDASYRTSLPNLSAVGDMIPGPMLAHKASAEGVAAVECMAGLPGEVNYDTIPSVIYTAPEVASVGLTQETVKARKIPFRAGSFPFTGTGRARCLGDTDGFVKIIVHGKTDRILGIHIIGPRAADMIAECALAMEFGASAEDIVRTVHAHPTFSEAFHEAAKTVVSSGE